MVQTLGEGTLTKNLVCQSIGRELVWPWGKGGEGGAINSLSKRFAIRDWGRDKTVCFHLGGGGKVMGNGGGVVSGKVHLSRYHVM